MVVAAAIGLVLLTGLVATWQTWQSAQRRTSGMMMDTMMTSSSTTTGPAPIWLFFGTVAIGAIVGVGYLVARETITTGEQVPAHRVDPDTRATTATSVGETETAPENGALESSGAPAPQPDTESASSEAQAEQPSKSRARPAILDVLPEDERRILEPVVESPGLTQIELRDRADFSKSKVSQTASDLEKRGLLSREKQGRTYRIYPAGELADEE